MIQLSSGNRTAADELLPLIYDDLRSLAANYLGREFPDGTLQPAGLINEAYLRLVDESRVNWKSRAHFFGVAAPAMRRLLADQARLYRAGNLELVIQKVARGEDVDEAVYRCGELLALDQVIDELTEFDERKGRLLELSYFGGLAIPEMAEALGETPLTIKRQWRKTRAWLDDQLNSQE